MAETLWVRLRQGSTSLRRMALRIMSRGFAAVIGFVATVVWTHSFDRDTYGKFQFIAAALAVVAGFCLPGLDDAALISSAKKKDGNLSPILRQRAAAATIGALVLGGYGAIRYHASDPLMMTAFLAAAVALVPMQLQPIWDQFTNGKARFTALSLGEAMIALAGLAGVAGFAIAGATDPSNLPWATLATFGLTGLVALGLLTTLRAMKENDERDASIIEYGHHVTAASLLVWVFKSDRLIVGEALSDGDVALLSVALVLPNQVKVFFTAFEQVFLPKVTAATSVAEAWAYIRPRMVRLWSAYTALGVIGFLLLPVIIPLCFSHKYVEAAPYARWVWLSLCLSSPFTFLASILNAQRDKRFLYLKNLATPAITLAMFALFIPRWGIAGAITARVASHVLIAALHIVYFARALRSIRAT
jgi:O-antigen/teichoic acid export membrane protein